MELNRNNSKKIILIAFSIILFTYMLFNFDKLIALFRWIVKLTMPFIIGFAIAFIVNVPMKGFEKVLFKNKNSKLYRFKRPVCMILALLCIILVITFAITMVLPEFVATVNSIGEKFPGAMEKIKNRAIDISKDYPEIVDKIMNIDVNWDKLVDTAISVVKNGGSSILTSTVSIASTFVGVVVDIAVGIFFAIYILSQKEILEKQTKGIIYAILKEKQADTIVDICVRLDRAFSNFISGQCLEACILGLMFFITMSLFHIPFALVVSILIALTALIPVFGAFIGCGIGTFLILVDDPKKVIVFLIMFVVLQQIEGNLIYPHVVGGSVGLPSIWVLVAVVLGGNMMGVVGMLIFVPLSSVLYVLAEKFVIERLRARKIPRQKYIRPHVIPELEEEDNTAHEASNTEEKND